MTACERVAVEIVDALRSVGATIEMLSSGNPTVLRADLGPRHAYLAIHRDGRATFLPRTPEMPLVPWAARWADWLAGDLNQGE